MAAIIAIHHDRDRNDRIFRDRINPLSFLSDAEVIERYRLSRNTIEDLRELIEADIAPNTNRSKAIGSVSKILVTLRYLAKGDFYSETGDIHGISRSSVSRILPEVVAAINLRLDNIKFPTAAEQPEIKKKFYSVAGLPSVLGAVDGTLIPMIAPSGLDEPTYVCRKGYHALNVQAIVGPDMRFTDVVAKWPGSQHDASVFDSSSIKRYLEGQHNGWLLGDSGYAQRHYIMTPKNAPTTQAEIRYNHAHSRTRMVVERAFGVLKSRFRCLHKSAGCLPFIPTKSCQIVTACMRLHNLCIANQIPHHDPSVDDNEENDGSEFHGQQNARGNELRQVLINNFA